MTLSTAEKVRGFKFARGPYSEIHITDDNGDKHRSNQSGHLSSVVASTNQGNIMDIDDVGLRAVATGSERFSNSFFSVLANSRPGNLITSPLSVQILLAMAAYGAGGQTATEMRTSLQLPRDTSLGQSGNHSLIKTMNAETEVELCIASEIFVVSHVTVKPAYQKLTAKKFLSSIQHVDFRHSRTAANAINAWCEEHTKERITDIVKPDSFGPDTAFVLVNVIYFKGQWRYPFPNIRTSDEYFQIDAHTSKLLPIMHNDSFLRIGDLPKLDARFIELPYKGENLSMIIILPNSLGGLTTVQDNLHKVNLKRSLQRVDRSYVKLSVPKFEIESTSNLKTPLIELGMTTMFQEAADFSGITNVLLNVIKAVQSAFIEVNETGTEAAAALMLRGGGSAMPEI